MKKIIGIILFLFLSIQCFGLVLGPEIVTNWDFDGNANSWTLGSGWVYEDSQVWGYEGVRNGSVSGSYLQQNVSLISGRPYLLTAHLVSVPPFGGSGTISLNGQGNLWTGSVGTVPTGTDVSVEFFAQNDDTAIRVERNSFGVIVESLSIKEVSANLNEDCVVNFLDFAMFAADWLAESPSISNPDVDFNQDDIVDVNDLLIFADQWLEYKTEERSPVAQSQSVQVFNILTKTVTLAATDANGDEIEYTILSLPTAEQGTITGISSVPHTLAGSTFEFDPNDTYVGTVVIQFQADDQTGYTAPCGGISTGTVTITVSDSPVNPTADAVNATAIANVMTSITLDAEDDGWPNPPSDLKYIITSLPTNGTLQDSLNGYSIIDSVPYMLANWGDSVIFVSDTTGGDSFQYKVFDGGYDPLDGYSNTATVSVTVSANLHDSLAFDGFGYVTFADHAKYDIVDGWAIDFWIKTNRPFEGLAKKRGSSGKGYEIGIVSGKPKIYLYDTNGTVHTARSFWRIDDGQWHEVGFVFNYTDGTVEICIKVDEGNELHTFTGESDYANSESLIVGLHARDGYKYEFDKLRFFTGINDPTGFGGIIQGFSDRTASGSEVILGFGKLSDVLFMCNEGTGTTLTDMKLSLTGTFNSGSHVLWTPPIKLFTDTSVAQYQFLNGGSE